MTHRSARSPSARSRELRARLDNECLTDLVLTIAFYNAVVRILATLQIDVEDEYLRVSRRVSAAEGLERMIVDAQVHLWKAESPDWPWIPGARPQMPEPFTIEKLVPLMDEAGVDRAVIVPPSWPGDRNDYALEAAKRYPNRFAVMGRIALKNPQSAALLPKWKEQPGMLGVRVTFQGSATRGSRTAPPTGSGRPPRRPGFPSCS